uniref:Uncharacterized protein n=1 Tax=Arundo donax TaxID=35708 RepID=A0A0A8YGG6_ARUDO
MRWPRQLMLGRRREDPETRKWGKWIVRPSSPTVKGTLKSIRMVLIQ